MEHGQDQLFLIDANPGFAILDVEVDGVSQGAMSTYTFENIKHDHTISASFEQGVEIINVSIPNFSMKIGDVVQATIEVTDDGGSAYSFISGTVGGYPLEDFRRISATSYLANFTITEGGNSYLASQDIPVTGLIISDGEMTSTSYDLPIVQDNDPIDAHAPVLLRLEVPSIAVGVGGVVTLTITADDSDYFIATGTLVNGIPVEFVAFEPYRAGTWPV